jgi:hypothetical protein
LAGEPRKCALALIFLLCSPSLGAAFMPLEDDFADRGYPRDLVHDIISGFAQFGERGEVCFTPSGARLSDRDVVLLYLASLRGFHLLKDRDYDGATFSEIEEGTCIPRRYLRDALAELERNRLIEKRWGRWTIREPALPIIKAEFDAIREAKNKEEKKDEKKDDKKDDKDESKKDQKDDTTEEKNQDKDGKSGNAKPDPGGCVRGPTSLFFGFSSGKD